MSAQKLLFSLRRTEFQKSQKFYFAREAAQRRGGGARRKAFDVPITILHSMQTLQKKKRLFTFASLFKETFHGDFDGQ